MRKSASTAGSTRYRRPFCTSSWPISKSWTEARRANARRYENLFAQYGLLDLVTLPNELPGLRHVYNQFTIRVKQGRRDVALELRSATSQIGAAIYYPIPLHLQDCFRFLGYKLGDLPAAEAASAEVLSLPIFAELGAQRQETVVRGVARALGRLGPRDERRFASSRLSGFREVRGSVTIRRVDSHPRGRFTLVNLAARAGFCDSRSRRR